jgi:hypothetical protein
VVGAKVYEAGGGWEEGENWSGWSIDGGVVASWESETMCKAMLKFDVA